MQAGNGAADVTARIVQLVTLAAGPETGNFIKPVAVPIAAGASEDRARQACVPAQHDAQIPGLQSGALAAKKERA